MTRIILAYSGGVNTSAAIPWLLERRTAEIVTVTIDVGQGQALSGVRERALALGARRAHVLDMREVFARRYLMPVLSAGVPGEETAPIGAVLLRPLLARQLVEIARIEEAGAIAHGCVGEDRIRFEALIHALDPTLQLIAVAARSGVKVSAATAPNTVQEKLDIDESLWGRTVTCRPQAGHETARGEEIYGLTRPPARCPAAPAFVEIEFEAGIPLTINGVDLPLVDLIGCLEAIAGDHGVGRFAGVASAIDGAVIEQFHEAPAMTVLHAAHLALADSREPVTGKVLLKLFKGDCTVIGCDASLLSGNYFVETPRGSAMSGHHAESVMPQPVATS